MKRVIAAFICAVSLFVLNVTAFADNNSFRLTAENMQELDGDCLEYMSEQKIYHFTKAGSVSAEIPVSGGIYAYVTAGGYRSPANGVTDNGVNRVCTVKMTFFDENGEVVVVLHADPLIMIPADGVFHRWSIGSDEMYSGLPDNVKKMCLTVTGVNDTAYIKEIYIASSDMVARDMSALNWETHEVGNINAQTGTVQRIIMVAFVCAVAAVMMLAVKLRDYYKKRK
ncbi:MAG: hypothetical protein J6O50_09425 [Ruminiclostridium sp.]|nr:hypothetical protein [Ruminiclostridium sp.]